MATRHNARSRRHIDTLPPGIFVTPTGFRTFKRVHGSLKSKRWPKDTSVTRMKEWQEEVRVRARLGSVLAPPDSTLADDARAYLAQVRSMPSYDWRKTDLDRWVRILGRDRDRRSITAQEVRTHLERWRSEGYAANTVNHRRTALMHLFTVLDGKSAPNPAKDVPRYRETPRPPRALSPKVIAALLQAMPESVTKARVELMAWTGWPHAQVMRLEPADIDWNRAVYIKPRQKGHGVAGRWLPLLPQAWKALRHFKKVGAWGQFSTSSMRKSLRLAASKLIAQKHTPKDIKAVVADITPYDLRHSFLTMVAVLSQNARAVQTLGLHSDPRQSNRYTAAAVDPLVLHALQSVTTALPLRGKRA